MFVCIKIKTGFGPVMLLNDLLIMFQRKNTDLNDDSVQQQQMFVILEN
jgi:hypothetical protein